MQIVTMPKASNSMEEGTVIRWMKREGDRVGHGDILLEIETDKAAVEVEAQTEGVMRAILVAEGAIVPIHAPLAIVAEASESIDAALAEARSHLGGAAAPAAAPAAAVASSPSASSSSAPPAWSIASAPAPIAGVVPILMPQAGNSMEEGTILKWRVAPGAKIEIGQIICEIETDKATMEIEASDAGRLAKIVAAEGAIVPVKAPIAILAESDADAEAWLKANGSSAPAAAAPMAAASAAPAVSRAASAPAIPASMSPGGRPKASPAARKVAGQRGIDLNALGAGSGPGGRILSTDVPAAAAAASFSSDSALRNPQSAIASGPGRSMSVMRRAIAKNLTVSKQTIPHFYMRLTVDAAPMTALYKSGPGRSPFSLNDIIVAGCARCMMEFPAFRGRLEGDKIIDYPNANIGIAVGTDDALVVPVIVAADQLSLRQLAATTRRTVTSAREGKVQNSGMGHVTISNLGMFGVEEFSAIINPPETAILAVSGIREEVIVKDGAMRAGRVMTITMSADHRVIDGLIAAKFMARMKQMLEDPQQLVGVDKA